MKRIISLMLIISGLTFAQTSGKVSGVVTDENGAPLAGANVIIEGTSQGAATDVDGKYYILGVGVGTYTLRAEYIGYQTLRIENVQVSANLTTNVDFGLKVAAIEGEMVEVVRERPLINHNATNTNRIVNKEVIENLAVRGVENIVALQTGVVRSNGNVYIRGARQGDNAYYVDGVLVNDPWDNGNTATVSQTAAEEISIQTGGFNAEFGNSNGGVINTVTKTGGESFSGSFEFVSDVGGGPGTNPDALYDYGYRLLNFDLGGSLGGIRYYLNVEQRSTDDRNPSYKGAPYMSYKEYQSLSAADSAALWDANGEYNDGIELVQTIIRDNQTNPDSIAIGIADYDTTYISFSDHKTKYGARRNAGGKRLAATGNVVFDLARLRLKVGGSYTSNENKIYSHQRQLVNWENNGQNDNTSLAMYLNTTLTLSSKSFLKVNLSQFSYKSETYNVNFKDNIEAYGKRSRTWGDPSYYYVRDGRDVLDIAEFVNFTGVGEQYGLYQQRSSSYTGAKADYLNQLGNHELKIGFEYRKNTIRYYTLWQAFEIAENINKMDLNKNGTLDESEISRTHDSDGNGYTDYEDWFYSVYRNAYTENIGYSIDGKETDKYGLKLHDQEPGKPIVLGVYAQDKIELKDLVVNFGVRYEYFNANSYAPDSDGDGIGDDAGFDNIHLINGRIDRSGDKEGSYKWEPTAAHTSINPRLGFSFPVTDETKFHAQYGSFSQHPLLDRLYLSDTRLAANLTQGNMTVSPNPTLKPERTTQYEIGFAHMINQSASIDVTGFYKEVRDYVLMANRQEATKDGSEFSWAQYMNGDFGVVKGFTFSLNMRRIKGVMVNTNYTMQWAEGTGSDPRSNFDIAWTGDTYPTVVNRLTYDQRHSGSVIVDYRSSEAKGLMSGVGINGTFSFGSGTAYTPSSVESAVFGRGWSRPVAAINSGNLPWTSRLDIRFEKAMELAGTDLTAYVVVLNALNTENVDNVYPSSGEAGNDGWLETPEGKVWLLSNPGGAEYYQDRLKVPARWDIPRIVRFGLSVNL